MRLRGIRAAVVIASASVARGVVNSLAPSQANTMPHLLPEATLFTGEHLGLSDGFADKQIYLGALYQSEVDVWLSRNRISTILNASDEEDEKVCSE